MPIKKITYYVSLVSLFVLPIFSLIVVNWAFFPFITGKAFFFRLVVELAFASWIILAFFEPKYRPKASAITVSVSIFALVVLLADLLGVNPLRSVWSNFERMEGWLAIVHLWMFYMVASSVLGSEGNSRKLWYRWLNVELLVGFIVAMYGVIQLFGWADTHQGSRIDASLGNAAYMAVYMLFNGGIAVFMFVSSKSRSGNIFWNKWIYFILALLFAFLVFETATRGTILAMIGGTGLALLIFAILGKRENKRNRYAAVGIIAAIVVISAVFWFNRSSSFVQSNETLRRMASISWSDTSNQARQFVWPMAIKGAMERPIFGWGQENFNYIFNENYNPKMWSQEQWFDRAHSVFLDWLVAGGLVGFASYLALYVLFLIVVWKSKLSLSEKSVLTGLLAGYFVHNIFVFDNLASYVMFFALLAFVSTLREGLPMRWLGAKPVREDAVEYIVAPIAIVLLVASIYFVNVRPLQANSRLIKAMYACSGNTPEAGLFQDALALGSTMANQEIREQLLTCANRAIASQEVPGPTKQAFFELSKREIEKQVKASPNDARIYTLAGSFMNSIGQVPVATELLEKAHELSPRKQSISFELANAYFGGGQYDKALTILEAAYLDEKSHPQAKAFYALALVVSGKEKEAREMFSDDPAIFNTPQMAQAYISLKQYPKAEKIYQDLIKASPRDVDLRAGLAQIQYLAGNTAKAIETLRAIAKDFPELKAQTEQAIKQLQGTQ